jgi:multidrug efflux pump subunit AcrA (membrane-fusion protein)
VNANDIVSVRRSVAGRAAAVVCAISLSLMHAPACSSPEPEGGEETPQAPVPVRTVAVASIETSERLEAGGTVAADASAVISSRIVAPVQDVRVRAGDRVSAGQVLAVLDGRDLAAQLESARAAVQVATQAAGAAEAEKDAAAADARLARTWHDRIAQLHDRNSATTQEHDEAQARLASAQARLAGTEARIAEAAARLGAARTAVASAEVTMSFATIRAPFDGVVTERMVDAGALASPGTPLLALDGGGRRKVRAQIDESRISYLRMGDRVRVEFEAGRDALADSLAVEGRVAEIARTARADERTFTVDVALPPGVTPRTGTFARVHFAGPPRRALVVPESALRRSGQIASVFVVQEGVARLRLVQSGPVLAGGVEILAGLEAGEDVVLDPPALLVDGRPVDATPASPAGVGQ